MDKRLLQDGSESFEASILDVERPSRVVVFSVGSGGNPERHNPLLTALEGHGCAVVAPHFERLVSPHPTNEQLLLRARRLRLALDAIAHTGVPVVGIGHSIGATVLLALAGAALWTAPTAPLPIAKDERLGRLALFAPPTGFFRAPNSLDAVRASLLVWAGEKDPITPPAQAEFLKQTLGQRVDLRITEGAGHFSFMNVLPPQANDPHPNREAFLAELTSGVCSFVLG